MRLDGLAGECETNVEKELKTQHAMAALQQEVQRLRQELEQVKQSAKELAEKKYASLGVPPTRPASFRRGERFHRASCTVLAVPTSLARRQTAPGAVRRLAHFVAFFCS